MPPTGIDEGPTFVGGSATAGGGTVTSVTASAPLASTGGTTPNIAANAFTFGTSGFAHVTAAVLDVGPSLGGAGQIPAVNALATDIAWVSLSGDVTMTAAGVTSVGAISGPAGVSGPVAVNGAATTLNFVTNAITLQQAGTTLLSLKKAAADFIAFGAIAAASGFVRAANASTIVAARNAGNTADIAALATDAANNVITGGANAAGLLWKVGATTVAQAAIASTDFDAFGVNPAGSGFIRAANASTIVAARNAGNTADIAALATDAANNVITGGANAGGLLWKVGATTVAQASIAATDFDAFGVNPAASGFIRTASTNGNLVAMRNSSNSADLALLSSDGTNTLNVGNSSAVTIVKASSSGLWVQPNGTNMAVFVAGGVQFFDNASTDLGGANGAIGVHQATTDPTTNPTSGIIIYVGNGSGTFRSRSPSGAVVDVAETGSGTVNSQTQRRLRLLFLGQLTGSAGTFVANVPLATAATQCKLRVVAQLRETVAGTTSPVGTSVTTEILASFKNVAGTVTQTGATTTVSTELDANVTVFTIAPSISGTNIVLTMSLSVGASTSYGTGDAEIWVDQWVN